MNTEEEKIIDKKRKRDDTVDSEFSLKKFHSGKVNKHSSLPLLINRSEDRKSESASYSKGFDSHLIRSTFPEFICAPLSEKELESKNLNLPSYTKDLNLPSYTKDLNLPSYTKDLNLTSYANSYAKKLRKVSLSIPLAGDHIMINQLLSKYLKSIQKCLALNFAKPIVLGPYILERISYSCKTKIVSLLMSKKNSGTILAKALKLRWIPLIIYLLYNKLSGPNGLISADCGTKFYNVFKKLNKHIKKLQKINRSIKKSAHRWNINSIIQSEKKIRKLRKAFFIDFRYCISTLQVIMKKVSPILFAIYFNLVANAIKKAREISVGENNSVYGIIESYSKRITGIEDEISLAFQSMIFQKEYVQACLDNADKLLNNVRLELKPETRLKNNDKPR